MGIFKNFIEQFKGKTSTMFYTTNHSVRRNINLEQNEICSAILDCNATHVARGEVLHVVKKDGRIQKVKRNSEYTKLFKTPNRFMTGYDLMYALTWQTLVMNTAFAWVKWDRHMNPVEIYPLVYLEFQLLKRKDGSGFVVELVDPDGERQLVDAEDLIVLRRKYDGAGFRSIGNNEIKNTIEISNSIDEALREAAQVSNKISGILSQKKAMMSTKGNMVVQEDASERIKFAAEHGGILSLDAMEDYTPLSPSTWVASAAQSKQITERLYAYWRTPSEVVNNTASEQMMQNYYDSIVEPFWEIMGQAFTNAFFTRKEQDFGNEIIISNGAATGASWQTKLNIVNNTKELGLLTINEYRELLGYSPIEDGDERFVSLNFINSKDQSAYQTGKGEGNE